MRVTIAIVMLIGCHDDPKPEVTAVSIPADAAVIVARPVDAAIVDATADAHRESADEAYRRTYIKFMNAEMARNGNGANTMVLEGDEAQGLLIDIPGCNLGVLEHVAARELTSGLHLKWVRCPDGTKIAGPTK